MLSDAPLDDPPSLPTRRSSDLTNDNASISGTATGAVVEAGGVNNGTPGTPTATGTLSVSDVDTGENVFQTPAIARAHVCTPVTAPNRTRSAATYTLDNSRTVTQ